MVSHSGSNQESLDQPFDQSPYAYQAELFLPMTVTCI